MHIDTAPTCDWIASVALFVFAILIILAFGFSRKGTPFCFVAENLTLTSG
jgi:hypothetical protein